MGRETISNNLDVATANQWAEPAQLLYLRELLREGYKDCLKATNMAGVFNNLRARYGLTPHAVLKRENRTTL